METETLVQNYIFELDKFFKIIDRSIDIIIIDLNFDILEWTKVINSKVFNLSRFIIRRFDNGYLSVYSVTNDAILEINRETHD